MMFISTGCSSLASVVCEKLLKEDDDICIRNAQLAFGALVVQCVHVAFFGLSVRFAHGSFVLYGASCYDALYGFLVSLFLKRFDSVSRNMSLVLSVCITFVAQSATGATMPGVFELVALASCVTAVALVTV